MEAEIAQLDAEEQAEFLSDLGVSESAKDRFLKTAFNALDLISFLTAGEDECRAWPIRRGTSARDAAGKIHTDIARGFIRAETIGFADFEALGSEQAAKAAGKYRLEGKEYEVQDGDIINFRFNV
jgi:ribosome-binding ATPase YchF (GTP1/OBG family)